MMHALPKDFVSSSAFLYSIGPHPATCSSVEAAGIPKQEWHRLKQCGVLSPYCETVKAFFMALSIPKHKYYLVEGSISLQIAFFKKKVFGERCIVVSRVNDELFSMPAKSRLKICWYRRLMSALDGALCNSQLVQEDARRACPVLPTRIARSFLHNEHEFFSVKPDLDCNNILFVGHYRGHKGVENMINGFLLFSKKHPEAMFTLVGRRIPSLKEKYPLKNLLFFDAVNDVKKYANLFSNARVYLHCPVYEAGPRTIFETMASGVIPLVSEMAGNKDLVKPLDKRLVVADNRPETIAAGLEYAYSIPKAKRAVYSVKAREIAKEHTFAKGTKEFVDQLASILDEIRRKKQDGGKR